MTNPRVFITTDMQMISGINLINGDKDDVQSMIHALLYQDKYDIVGIASSTSYWQPGKNSADLIHHVLDVYGKDQDALAKHDDGFKTADELHAITYQGTKSLAGSSGLVAPTAASAAIIKAAREAEADGVPLYVTAWGGMGDIARALHDAPDIADTVRLLSVAGKVQEPNAYAYIKSNFAGKGDLWWVDEATSHRGVYATPDSKDPISDNWALTNAKGHGDLGEMFYQNTQDIRGTVGNVDGMKMGDSHTIFYLIDAANNDDPTAEGWGGEYRKIGDKLWTDRTDNAFNWANTAGARTIYEDRVAWTSDFAKRLDWLKESTTTTTPLPTATGKVGTSGNDSMLGTAASDTLSGVAGNDTLDGAAGSDRLAGGIGNDVYYVRQAGDIVVEGAGEGIDIVHAFISATLSDNVENLSLRSAAIINGTGNALANVIRGNSSANVLDGKAGNDTLAGGGGDDLFVFAAGHGDDVITDFTAGAAEDRLRISGYSQYDSKEQIGNDTLLTFGSDSILLMDVDADDLTDFDFLFASSTKLAPAPAPSTIQGPTAGKVGTGGNDSMLGTSASDTLSGAAGNDTIDGAAGNDHMVGGTGNDAYYVRQSGDIVVEHADEGTDIVHAFVSTTLAGNVENLSLRSAAVINGTGNALDNVVGGNSSANILDGKEGNDTLTGAGGNDRIVGGTGDDLLAGGAGNDLFVFTAGHGHDTIADFVAGGSSDRLQISGYGKYDSREQVGSDTLLTFGGDSILLKDVDADQLTSADFLFV